MISMKKTAIAAALAFGVIGAAQAAPVVNFSFAGHFVMLSSAGGLVGDDPGVTGAMNMDMGSGYGNAAIASPNTFFGYNWTAHNIVLSATGPSTVHADMFFDWGVNPNIHVTVDFSMVPDGFGGYTVTTLDGPGADGIPGNPMDNGPFVGFNATFNGTATPTGMDNTHSINSQGQLVAAPIPAAAWLLGSGLLGLVGVARRKYA